MHKVLVLYGEPKDPAHFKRYYEGTHLPMARQMPGMIACRYGYGAEPLGPGSGYFCVFEAEFQDLSTLQAALSSEHGRKVTGDVANYASGGATVLHYEVAG